MKGIYCIYFFGIKTYVHDGNIYDEKERQRERKRERGESQ